MRTIIYEENIFINALKNILEKNSISLTEAQTKRILKHYERLCYWNKSYNLTSISDTQEIAERHFGDSIIAIFLSDIHSYGNKKCETIDDIGSGGGFPGLVIAAMYPEKYLRLIESVNKKSAFQEDVIFHFKKISSGTDFNCEVINTRAEKLDKINHIFTRATFSWGSPILDVIAGRCLSLTMWVNNTPSDDQWNTFTNKHNLTNLSKKTYLSYETKYLRHAKSE